MVAVLLAALAVAAPAHPCRAPLPKGPAVPAPIVLRTSCGGFLLTPSGRVTRLPRHWFARHGGGTGRRWGAQLNVRRNRAGAYFLLRHGHVVWRSHALYLTEAGRAMLARVREVTRAHEAAVTASLSDAERDQLTALLRRLAGDQGLAEHSLPGVPRHQTGAD